jgi:glyoxylase-like metal-dependent hydrolase (beta-lactamase superfamily II)
MRTALDAANRCNVQVVDREPLHAGVAETDAQPVFQMGDIAVHVISDGELSYPTDFLYPNVPSDELAPALAGRLNEEGHLWVPYQCLLVTTPSQTLLIDSGLGPAMAAAMNAPAGRMLDSLDRAGFAPADIDTVVISHAHPDHIGGLAQGGNLTFPGARHVIEAREWACWTDEDQLRRMPDLLTGTARAVLPLLAKADVVDVVAGETELLPGVQLVPAPGHTLGHCVLTFASGAERAIFLADALLDQLQLTHPTWLSAADMVPDDTIATRTRLLDSAARDGSLVLAYHLARIGHVERDNEGYRMI